MSITEFTRARTSTDFMTGLICGAAVGAVAGLLMATKPGKELRNDIAGSAERFRRKMTDTYQQASDAMAEAVDKGRDALRKGRETFEDVRARHEDDEFAAENRF